MFLKLTQIDGGDTRQITVQTEHIMFMYIASTGGTCLMLGTYGAVTVTDKMEDILMFMDLPQLDILKVKVGLEEKLKSVTSLQFQLEHQSKSSVHDTLTLNVLQGQRMAFEEAISVINENLPENLPF